MNQVNLKISLIICQLIFGLIPAVHSEKLERFTPVLESCTNITHLELDVQSFHPHHDETAARCSAMLKVLSAAPPSLRHVTLHFRCVDPMLLWPKKKGKGVLDWEQAEAAFERLKSLESVVFDLHGLNYDVCRVRKLRLAKIVRLFRLRSPVLAARGICQLRLNRTLFSLPDGIQLSDELVPRCRDEMLCDSYKMGIDLKMT